MNGIKAPSLARDPLGEPETGLLLLDSRFRPNGRIWTHDTAINAALSAHAHGCGMVSRKRLHAMLTTLGLYVMAALLIGYFGVNALNGRHGLKAKESINRQIAKLSAERARLDNERTQWERRIALLKPSALDPDMLDERARALLYYADPNDLTLMLDHARPAPNGGP